MFIFVCRNAAVIKSSKDTRYGLDSIVTHDGEKLSCWPLEALSSFKERIGLEAYHKVSYTFGPCIISTLLDMVQK